MRIKARALRRRKRRVFVENLGPIPGAVVPIDRKIIELLKLAGDLEWAGNEEASDRTYRQAVELKKQRAAGELYYVAF